MRRSRKERPQRAKKPRPPRAHSIGRRYGVGLLGLALVGLATSLYLTYAHRQLQVNPGWRSICAVSSGLNCDTVISSPYGSVAGIPLSAFALYFYLLISVVSIVGLRGNRKRFPRSPAAIVFVASAFAVSLSVFLGFVSTVWIGSLCVLCSVLYAVNLAMLIVAWRAVRATGEGIPGAVAAEIDHWTARPGRAAWRAGGTLAFLAVIPYVYSHAPSAGSGVCEAVAAAVRSNTEAITLVVYSDFQCPHCKALDLVLRPLRDTPGLRIVPRYFPLDNTCNPVLKRPHNHGSCLQARAAICADAQGRQRELSDGVFDRGVKDRKALGALAASLTMDRARFESCLWSKRTAAALDESISAAIASGVKATPTLFVNGRRHVGRLSNRDLSCLTSGAAALRSRQQEAKQAGAQRGGF